MKTFLRRVWYALRPNRFDRDLQEELQLHFEHKRRELEAAGLKADEASVAAARALGNLRLARSRARDVWVWPQFHGVSTDFRLGVRMLVKHPALTIVGGLAMAFGIWSGVGGFAIRSQMVDPSLPLDEGDRLVGLRHWDVEARRADLPTRDDFVRWRTELTTVGEIGAFATSGRNLIAGNTSEPIDVAEITATGFNTARVPALLGRTLVEADERPDASAVVVLGYALWQRRFDADRGVIGHVVRIGAEPAAVVGVMPEAFAFPVAHELWMPLRNRAGDVPVSATPLLVFGRLARGVSLAQAQAELATIGRHAVVDFPDTHARLRPQVVPYATMIVDPGEYWQGLALSNVFLVMLLMLVCANVALLILAQSASRETEIAVRSALGASRTRIIRQLFVEALVIAGLATTAGLMAARVGLRSFWSMYAADSGTRLPFWFNDRLTPATILYAGLLTLVGAAIISVLPALDVTGRNALARLRRSTAGAGGYRFGGVWTLVIAMQVAVTMTLPAAAFFFHRWVVNGQTRDVGFPAHDYASARLQIDGDATGITADRSAAALQARVGRTYDEITRRLVAEPGVAAVTFADRLPGTLHPRWWIETDNPDDHLQDRRRHEASIAVVAVNFFDVVGVPPLLGRNFKTADLGVEPSTIIVNQTLVAEVFNGHNPIGRRVRRAASREDASAPGPWLEIVGAVRDLGMVGSETGAGLYRPLSPAAATDLRIAVRMNGDPGAFLNRFREVVADVDPTVQVRDLLPLDEVGADLWLESQYLSRLLSGLSAVALLLSLMTIYAVLAFTVTARTREIGLRVALGSDPGRVILLILRRPSIQIAAGITLGSVLVTGLYAGVLDGTPTAAEAGMIAAYAVLVMGVCMLACIVPARRALRIEPTEALRVEI